MFLSDRIAGQPVQTLYLKAGEVENLFEIKCPTHYPVIYPSNNSHNCYSMPAASCQTNSQLNAVLRDQSPNF
jgi:hypothetical protein